MIARAKKDPHVVRKEKYTWGKTYKDHYDQLWQDCQGERQSRKKSNKKKGHQQTPWEWSSGL